MGESSFGAAFGCRLMGHAWSALKKFFFCIFLCKSYLVFSKTLTICQPSEPVNAWNVLQFSHASFRKVLQVIFTALKVEQINFQFVVEQALFMEGPSAPESTLLTLITFSSVSGFNSRLLLSLCKNHNFLCQQDYLRITKVLLMPCFVQQGSHRCAHYQHSAPLLPTLLRLM